MGWQLSVYALVALLGGLLTTWLATVGWRRRDRTGATAFTAMMIGIAWWCFRDTVRFGVTTEEGYQLATLLGFPSHMLVVAAMFVFVLHHVGLERWVNGRTITLLSIQPIITLGLLLTNDRHGLLWEYSGGLQTDPVSTMSMVWGPWWDFHLLYHYALVVAVIGLLGWFLTRSRGPYRLQTSLMLFAVLVPLGVNALWLIGASPIPGTEITSLALAVTGAIFAIGLFSFDLLDLAPVARHTVVKEAHDGVVTVDRDDRVIDANPAARKLLTSGDPLVGQQAAAVVPRYDDVLAGEDVEDVAIQAADGPRYFDVQVTPLTDAAGTTVGKVLVLRDVTERRQVEKRYQLLTENSSDLIQVIDPHGDIQYVSPSVQRVLDYDPEDLKGKNAIDFVHEKDRDAVVSQLQEILDKPANELQVEYRVRHADGTYTVVESRGRNLLDDPVVNGIVINSRDISDRKHREERLRHQNRQLEEFANVISHDLRSPLTVARGYADLIADEYEDERLDRVHEAHLRMDELLGDLLELAREGRVVDDPEPVDLNIAAREAWSTVDTESATLSVDGAEEVLADPSRLRELLENLFCNAIEHGAVQSTEEGGRASEADLSANGDGREQRGKSRLQRDGRAGIAVEVGRLDNGRGFYVQDNGPGIPQSDREEVFEPGFSTAKDGTGFGLAIVKEIVDAHGWRVAVTDADEWATTAGDPDRSPTTEEHPGTRFEFTDIVYPDDAFAEDRSGEVGGF